jgi:cysteinyl-tRNA synthetase
MNITDVGHLTSDEDAGEDKVEKGAIKSGKTVWELTSFYTDIFFNTMKQLNVLEPAVVCKATDHVQDMIDLIKILEEKGITYVTEEAVYFDVTKFSDYGRLSRQDLLEKQKGVRPEVVVDPNKKNPADFALWFKRQGRFANHTMHWDSPWGDGFPGWHIECSAMSMKYLGPTIDIHTGGVDHIPVHHENEIAQSEAATGKQFVRLWLHHNHLHVDGEKMSKSKENFYTLEDVVAHGIDPKSLRLLFLQTHYRQPMNFTWNAAKGAHETYKRLKEYILAFRKQNSRTMMTEDKLSMIDHYQLKFRLALENDLQTPQALAIMWDLVKSNVTSEDKLDQLYEFDRVLGLGLREMTADVIPDEIKALAKQRQQKRAQKEYEAADVIRQDIEHKGYIVEDVGSSFKLKKK